MKKRLVYPVGKGRGKLAYPTGRRKPKAQRAQLPRERLKFGKGILQAEEAIASAKLKKLVGKINQRSEATKQKWRAAAIALTSRSKSEEGFPTGELIALAEEILGEK